MQALSAFVRGFTRPYVAFHLVLNHPGLKRYLLFPMLLALTLYSMSIAGALYGIAHWDWGYTFPILGEWLGGAVAWSFNAFKWLLLLPILTLLTYFTFTSVGMILASPLNDLLSERVERILCEPRPPLKLPFNRWLCATYCSLRDSSWIAAKQLFSVLLVLPLLLIPVIGFIPLLLVNAHYTGRGCLEVGTARNFLTAQHAKKACKRYRWEMLGLGLSLEILFLIPLLGLLVLPLGVVAGTQLYCAIPWDEFVAPEVQPLGFQPPVPRKTRSDHPDRQFIYR